MECFNCICWTEYLAVYGKVNLQQKVNLLQAESIHEAGLFSVIAEPVRFIFFKSQAKTEPPRPLTLIAVFTDYGCTSCVIAEIEYLNEWNKAYNNTLEVYYRGISKGYLEQFGAEFDYQEVAAEEKLFNVAMPVGNPIAVVVDENQYVQAIHTNDLSRLGSEQRRENFYRRVESLFRSVYKEQ